MLALVLLMIHPKALDSDDDWQAPITKPDDDKMYHWDEDVYQADNSKGWVEVE